MVSANVARIAGAARPALLSHALHLTGGHHAAAEDLVQDTYLRLVERPPRCRQPRKVKGWLMIVMRNLWAARFPRLRIDDRETRQEFRAAALRGGTGPHELLFAAGAESLDA